MRSIEFEKAKEGIVDLVIAANPSTFEYESKKYQQGKFTVDQFSNENLDRIATKLEQRELLGWSENFFNGDDVSKRFPQLAERLLIMYFALTKASQKNSALDAMTATTAGIIEGLIACKSGWVKATLFNVYRLDLPNKIKLLLPEVSEFCRHETQQSALILQSVIELFNGLTILVETNGYGAGNVASFNSEREALRKKILITLDKFAAVNKESKRGVVPVPVPVPAAVPVLVPYSSATREYDDLSGAKTSSDEEEGWSSDEGGEESSEGEDIFYDCLGPEDFKVRSDLLDEESSISTSEEENGRQTKKDVQFLNDIEKAIQQHNFKLLTLTLIAISRKREVTVEDRIKVCAIVVGFLDDIKGHSSDDARKAVLASWSSGISEIKEQYNKTCSQPTDDNSQPSLKELDQKMVVLGREKIKALGAGNLLNIKSARGNLGRQLYTFINFLVQQLYKLKTFLRSSSLHKATKLVTHSHGIFATSCGQEVLQPERSCSAILTMKC